MRSWSRDSTTTRTSVRGYAPQGTAGVEVGWAEFDPATSEIAVEDVERWLIKSTRLVAVTAASNLIGTRPPIREIGRLAPADRRRSRSAPFYALEASRRLGLGETGGIRLGLAPYSCADDVDRLLEALRVII